MILYGVTLIIVQLMPSLHKSVIAMIAGVIFVVTIFIFAPVINENNELNTQQIKRNKTIIRLMLIIYVALLIILFLFNIKYMTSGIVFIGLVCALMCVEKILLTARLR